MSKKRTVKARSPEYEELGKRLAEARNSLDISQSEAARRIGITQSTYSGYETGTRRIKLSMLQKIAVVYNVTVDYLIGTSAYLENRSPLMLSDQEHELIEKYRTLSETEKSMIRRSLGIFGAAEKYLDIDD